MIYIGKSHGSDVHGQLTHLSRRTFVGLQLAAFIPDLSFGICDKKCQPFPGIIHGGNQRQLFRPETLRRDRKYLLFKDPISRFFNFIHPFQPVKPGLILSVLLRRLPGF